MPYESSRGLSAYSFETFNSNETAEPFTANIAVVSGDVISMEEVSYGEDSYGSAILVDVRNSEALYSRNPHERLYPASLTKVMTAVVALEKGSLDQVLVMDESCMVTEDGAQVMGLESGDSMTLDQALHIMLVHSCNDVAMLIAKNISGSVEAFCEEMNETAHSLGATNSNFINPHGLHDEKHYSCAYDLYLIFNRAARYEEFKQIIGMDSYTTVYKGSSGEDIEYTCKNTNRYMTHQYALPSNITMIGGKTGTTIAAGSCLLLYTKNASGDQFISCVLKGRNVDVTYGKTNSILSLAGR